MKYLLILFGLIISVGLFAQDTVAISELTEATTLEATDEFVFDQTDSTRKVTWQMMTDTLIQEQIEAIQDIMGAMWSSNTETLITITYQDSDGTVDAVVSGVIVPGDTAAMLSVYQALDAQLTDLASNLTATATEINTPLDGASVTLTEFQELESIGATTISANQWAILGALAATLTGVEVSYMDGVSSAVQTQLNAKLAAADTSGLSVRIAADSTLRAAHAANTSNPHSVVVGDITILDANVPNDITIDLATTVTTNANLTGDVTSTGNATDITESVLEDGGTDELAITAGMVNAGTNASAATYFRGDNTWVTPSGSGDVSKVGTPANDQVGIWTGDGTLEGDVDLTFDGDNLTVDGVVTGTGFTIGSAVIAEAELEIIDGSTVTTTELEQLATVGATTVSAAQWTGLGGATTAGIALWDDADAAAQLATLGTQSTSTADAAYEAELDNSAGLLAALSDETGTGVAVFGTSPTITTGITVNGTMTATGNVSGTTGTALHTAATYVFSAVDSCRNWGHFNNDADAIDFTLPGAAAGLVVIFYDIAGGVITVDPVDGTDTIYLNGTSVGAGDAIDSPGDVGDFIALWAVDATRWFTIGRSGTWVDGGAD